MNNIISHFTTLTITGGFMWAYKNQTLQSFLASLLQACRVPRETVGFYCWMPTYPATSLSMSATTFLFTT